MTVAQLQGFVAVVDAGSFTAAGRALGTSQSSVSQTVAGLEEELGVTLLRRGRDGVTLTHVGERLLGYARSVLSHLEHMRQEAAAEADLAIGKLRLASFSSAFTGMLPALAGAFQRRYPGVDLVLLEGADPEVRGWIRAGVADVGLLTLPAEGLETIPLGSDELMVVVPANHPMAACAAVRVDDLAGEPFVLPRGGCEAVVRSLLGHVAPPSRHEVRDMGTLFALVREGLGVTMVPSLALAVLPADLKALPLDPPVRRAIGLAVRSPHALSPAVAAFIAQARGWATAHGLLTT